MKISIIVPVYNEGQRAVETIKKILLSTKQDMVVVDDGSGDNSWSLLKKIFSRNRRIKLLRHVINLGKGAAMKTGTEKTTLDGGKVECLFFEINVDTIYIDKYKKGDVWMC